MQPKPTSRDTRRIQSRDPNRSPRCLVGACALTLGLHGQVLAQDTPDDPFADPLPVFRETDPILPVDPDAEPEPGAPSSEDGDPSVVEVGSAWLEEITRERLQRSRARLMAEGTFLTARPGTLLTAPSGHRVFLPDASLRGGNVPIVLLPSRTLSALDAATRGMNEPRVTLSGQILAFQGRNYLVVSAYRVTNRAAATETRPAAAQPQPPQPARPEPRPSRDASATNNPDVDALFEELANTDAAAGLEPPTIADVPEPEIGEQADIVRQPAADPRPTDTAAMQEGTQIVRRLGRLARLSDGSWAVFFDNDHDTAGERADPDEPMTVFPCTTLSRIIPLAQRRGDRMELLVSGRVYTYGARRYLLPTRFTVARDVGVDPRQ